VYLTHLEKPIFEASHAMEGTLLLSHLFPFFAFLTLFFCLQKSNVQNFKNFRIFKKKNARKFQNLRKFKKWLFYLLA
jgi:hypothetical protein